MFQTLPSNPPPTQVRHCLFVRAQHNSRRWSVGGVHSPFAKALLDAKRGCFAEGFSLRAAIEYVNDTLGAQKMVTINLQAIPADFQIRPKPAAVQAESGGAAGSSSNGRKRKREADAHLLAMLVLAKWMIRRSFALSCSCLPTPG